MSAQAYQARAGDPVRLKSGGVVMTVEWSNPAVEHPFAKCVWLDARQVLHRAFISLDALELVSPEQLTSTDCPDTRMAGGDDPNASSITTKRR